VAALGSAWQLDVGRARYGQPIGISQVIFTGHGKRLRHLPRSVLNFGWYGLRDFASITVRDRHGKPIGTHVMNFCPNNSLFAQRTGPGGPLVSPYPLLCRVSDPFALGAVWGIAKDWAADPTGFGSPYRGGPWRLKPGTYRVTETILPRYTRLLRISRADSSATVTVHVVKGRGSGRRRPASGPLPRLPRNVPTLRSVPRDALPDLAPLPSWDISTSTVKKTHQDYLNFGATVGVLGGSSPLDVQGFRKADSEVMTAYQYFWHDGKVIGRTRARTMGFDGKKGHHHWHFEQFARYQLLTASKKLAVRSEKVGFCIAPTDPVNLLLPHAFWNPSEIGLGGNCGESTALWVRENMPIGWADTYDQSKAGQAFNITKLPNGTYYIEVIANPEHVLHETTRANDVSLRKVIITGTKGHRHVTVPAWHGIDPEK
jgi:lysyl oxidase